MVAGSYENMVLNLLPEVSGIQDVELREKVIKAWCILLAESVWDNVEDVPIYPGLNKSNITHTRSVANCCMKIAEVLESINGYQINKDYLLAGSLLHDISKAVEYSPEGGMTALGNSIPHAVYGVHLAISVGIPPEVIHMIASHTNVLNTQARTIEALILHQIDHADAGIHALLVGEVPFTYR